MKQFLDIVNFNADASCLPSRDWLEALSGGETSDFCCWLKIYINNEKKVVLGLTGATVADLCYFNREAIDIINQHPGIFEILIRSFSHDISLLRSRKGFKENFDRGQEIIKNEFKNVQSFFLPAEFMLTNEQVSYLSGQGIKGVFINSDRFNPESASKIPDRPYMVQGIFNRQLVCIPVNGQLTKKYLETQHLWEADNWNAEVRKSNNLATSWRDGESWLFVPDGIQREEFWLQSEKRINRVFLSDLDELPNSAEISKINKAHINHFYPFHSFTAWLRELRMLGFIHRLQVIEDRLDKLSDEEKVLWLQLINSDVLSAVEKNSPVIKVRPNKNSGNNEIYNLTIPRSDRGFEGEEYLAIFETNGFHADGQEYMSTGTEPHLLKLKARTSYFFGER